jgi:hypothetical protein
MPFPADCALPKTFVLWLSITELTAWITGALTGEAIFRQSLDAEITNRKQPARLR